MVHRPSDSRLLSALLTTEQSYSKSLLALLSCSQSSLASFSAYAAASSPPTSHAILAVAGSLAGADDALRRYAHAVDVCRNELESLKNLEDEVGNVIRDREILVTRLIKASKSQKPTRESLLLPTANSSLPASTSSLSILSGTSLPTTAKLNTAQAELQACEVHLAALEKSLEVRRRDVIQNGLSVRSRAMVECGWAWGEMGKEGLRALETIGHRDADTVPFPNELTPPSSISHHDSHSQSHSHTIYRSLPSLPPQTQDPQPSRSSSLSLSPSQSASNGHTNTNSNATIRIPAAHKIDDQHLLPLIHHSQKHVLTHRISEITEPESQDEEDAIRGGGQSPPSSEEIHGELKVVENERFKGYAHSSGSTSKFVAKKLRDKDKEDKERPSRFSIRTGGYSSTRSSGDSPSLPSGPDREREPARERKSSGFLGSIRGFFGGKSSRNDSDDEIGVSVRAFTSSSRPRLDDWVAYSSKVGEKEKKRGDVKGAWNLRGREMREEGEDEGEVSDSAGGARLKKKRGVDRDNSPAPIGKRVEDWVVGQQSKEHLLLKSAPSPDQITPTQATSTGKRKTLKQQTKHNTALNTGTSNGGTLSRSSSLTSSAPATNTTPTPTSRRRTISVEGGNPKKKSAGTTISSPPLPLMSIVGSYVPSTYDTSDGGTMVVPKAPPRLSRAEIDGLSPLMMKVDEVRGGVRSSLDGGERAKAAPNKLAVGANKSGIGESRPAKSPLRSALRGSRTPSPMNGGSGIDEGKNQSGEQVTVVDKDGEKAPVAAPDTKSRFPELQADGEEEDSASISSYETVHEAFDNEGDGDGDGNKNEEKPCSSPKKETSHPPPPHKDGNEEAELSVVSAMSEGKHKGTMNGQVTHQTSVRESTPRRKTVRVSLKPEFSPTPPAVDDDGNDYTWGGGANDSGRATPDVWEDSSEEDEEYARARRLLGRAARKTRAVQ